MSGSQNSDLRSFQVKHAAALGLIQTGSILFFRTPTLLWLSPLATETTNKRVGRDAIVVKNTVVISKSPSPVPFSFAQRVCAGFAQLGEMLPNIQVF